MQTFDIWPKQLKLTIRIAVCFYCRIGTGWERAFLDHHENDQLGRRCAAGKGEEAVEGEGQGKDMSGVLFRCVVF